MSQAIFGLVGVVVGALITVGFEWWRDWRRERAEAVAGLRLLESDLANAEAVCAVALRDGWWAGGRTAPTTAWRQYRTALVRVLDRSEWHTLEVAMASVESLFLGFDMQLRQRERPEGVAINDADRDHLADVAQNIRDAQAVLRAHVEPWERRPRRRQRHRSVVEQRAPEARRDEA